MLRALEADFHRPKRERRTAKALHAELQAQGYTGGYTVLTDFIQLARASGRRQCADARVRATEVRTGEAFQFDWSEDGLVIGGIWRKLLVAHMKLCASLPLAGGLPEPEPRDVVRCAHAQLQALGGWRAAASTTT